MHLRAAFSGLISAAQNCYNRVSSIWNSLKGIVSKIVSNAQKVLGHIIPDLGGGKAQGGKVNRAGQYWVGEQGPEIVTLPKGAVVTSNKDISGNVGYKVEKEDVKRWICSRYRKTIYNRCFRHCWKFMGR